MTAKQTSSTDKPIDLTRRLMDRLFAGNAAQPVSVRLWDGTQWPDASPRPATMVLNHPGALRRMLLSGTEVRLAEAYLYDDFDVEGDIETVLGLANSLAQRVTSGMQRLRLARDLLRLPADGRRAAGQRGAPC